ncbi:MAG: amino acid permease [Elusimicrobiota bacterium]
MGKFETQVRLSREMSLFSVTMIGVGAMIGAGIFVLTGIAAGLAGPGLILAFGLNGVVTLFSAMAYAELGSCFHDAGGGYLWVKEGLPKANGFLSGWMSWFAHAVACAVYALGFGAYLNWMMGSLGISVNIPLLGPEKFYALVICLLMAYVNYKGASETGSVGAIVTIGKLLILGVFLAVGIPAVLGRVDWQASYQPFLPHGAGGVFVAMGLTFISFEGYEIITQCSEELVDPKRNVPRAIFLSLLIVIPVYLLVAFTAIGAVQEAGMRPWEYLGAKKEVALVEVATTFFKGGGVMLLFAGVISTVSALNATIYSSSRVAFAMGRDRNFPKLFASVHPERRTPHWAIAISIVVILLMALSLPIEEVAMAADIMFLLLFLQVQAAMISLRRKRPELDRGFVMPLFPVLPAVGIAVQGALAVFLFFHSVKAGLICAAWVAVGLAVYKWYASRREIEFVTQQTLLRQLEKKKYRILACVNRKEQMGGILQAAMAVARKHRGQILVLHAVEVGDGEPLHTNLEQARHGMSLLEDACETVAMGGVPVRPILVVGHRVSQIILETSQHEACNFIVMGRASERSLVARLFNVVVEEVVSRSTAEVAIVSGSFDLAGVKRVFLPFQNDRNARLALELAPALIERSGAKLTMGLIFPPDAPSSEVEKDRAQAEGLSKAAGLDPEIRVIYAESPAWAIVSQSWTFDLVLMGGSSATPLEYLVGANVVSEVLQRITVPSILFKEYEEPGPGWLRELLFVRPETREKEREAA